MKIRLFSSLFVFFSFLNFSLSEKRHVIELYNKNHKITKNTSSQNPLQNNAYQNILANDDNEASAIKKSNSKIIDPRLKNIHAGIDYVQEGETFTLNRRKPRLLKPNQDRKLNVNKITKNLQSNKFRDYTTNISKQNSFPVQILNVPTQTTQNLNSPQAGRIALESSPNNIIIEAPLYDFVSHEKTTPHSQYGEYPLPEVSYAQVKFVPDEQKNKISQALAHSVAVPPLSSNVDAIMNEPFSQRIVHPQLPVLQNVPLTEQLPVQFSQIRAPDSLQLHDNFIPFTHQPNPPHTHGHSPESRSITEAEIQAEIMEHFFNDDFFKGFFETGSPILPSIPEPVSKPESPIHQTPLGYEAPYTFPSKASGYNIPEIQREMHKNVVYPLSSVSYQQPGVHYHDELKTAYSNNVEKKLNITESPVDAHQDVFPITIKKKIMGQENLRGKPWGQKTVISYSDPKDPNNFVQVSEMRMTLNRPLDSDSADDHITKLMDHFGTEAQHHSESKHSFDDRK